MMNNLSSVLTKRELAHLQQSMDTITLDGVSGLREYQKELAKERGVQEVCDKCRKIAQKLGIE